MNTNRTAVIATERQQRYLADAADYRRRRTARPAEPAERRARSSHRVRAFLKSRAAESL